MSDTYLNTLTAIGKKALPGIVFEIRIKEGEYTLLAQGYKIVARGVFYENEPKELVDSKLEIIRRKLVSSILGGGYE